MEKWTAETQLTALAVAVTSAVNLEVSKMTIYANNAWSSKMLQDDLAISQERIDEKEFRQAIADGAISVIGHPDTAEMFGVENNRQTLVLTPGDIIYVCELNNPEKTRFPEGTTRMEQLPDGFFFRFLKITVFEIP